MATIEEIKEAQNKVNQIFDELLGGEDINLTASFQENGVLVEWEPFSSDESDLYFYAENLHEEWEHSVNMYEHLHGEPLDTESGSRLLAGRSDREDYTWYFKLVADGEEETTSVKKDNSSDDGDDDQDEELLKSQFIEIDNKGYAGYTKGLAEDGDVVRFYYEDREPEYSNDDGFVTRFVEASKEDLTDWNYKGKVNVEDYPNKSRKHGNAPTVKKVGDEWLGWSSFWDSNKKKGGLALLKSNDGINFKFDKVAFYGEVDAMTDYYDGYFYARNRFSNPDRRGLNVWKEGDLITTIDPKDIWNYNDNWFGIYDCISVGDGEIIANVYWKTEDRKIVQDDGDVRYTGPIYPIYLEADGSTLNNLEVKSNDYIIPLEQFERVHPNSDATSQEKEIGMVFCNSYLELDKYNLFGILHNEATHYEGFDGADRRFYIYIQYG